VCLSLGVDVADRLGARRLVPAAFVAAGTADDSAEASCCLLISIKQINNMEIVPG
jgi:hypothetical protein